MLYPTGKTTGGRCLVCMSDHLNDINEKLYSCNENCVLECLNEWLSENNYCLECWQVNEYLKNKGYKSKLNEDGSAAPAPGLATVGNVSGMGNPATPTNDGTNAGFYNAAKVGSGDRFDSLTVGTPASRKRKKNSSLVKKFQQFIKTGKKGL
jgi:hypothetical protein